MATGINAIYKKIDNSKVSVTEKVTYHSQSLSTLTVPKTGHESFAYRSGSVIINPKLSSSFDDMYNSLYTNFYFSGSELAQSESKFDNPGYQLDVTDYSKPIHTYKFHKHKRGIVYSFGQNVIGESIKPGSFDLTDVSDTYPLNIKDDGLGNLFAQNAIKSESHASLTHPSNYVGNIFYRYGIAVIHPTGSYSGSALYTGLGQSYTANFLSTKTIYASEYSITINPHDFNRTNNPTAHEVIDGEFTGYLSGSFYSIASGTDGMVKTYWSPYFNTIGFLDEQDEIVAVAKYPQPIKVRDDVKLTCKVKLDF